MHHSGSTRRRATVGASVAALAILVGAPEAVAASPSCTDLKGRDLVKNDSIKLVDSRTKRGGRILHHYAACPQDASSGRQLTLSASRKGGALTVLDSAGAFVVVRDVRGRMVDVWDVVKRKRTRLTDGGQRPSGNVVIDPAGDIAAVFGTALVGFDGGDTRYVLDAGPVAADSLKRNQHKVTWRAAGTRKRADLDAPALACAALSGKTVFSTPEVIVSEHSYRANHLFAGLDGTAIRTRACVLPGGPVRVVGTHAYGIVSAGGGSFTTVAGAGHFLLLWEYDETSNSEVETNDYTLYDVVADQRVKLWQGRTEGEGPIPSAIGNEFLGAVVTAGGQVGAAFAIESTAKQIVAFDAAGQPRILDKAADDAIDERSLRLDGTILHWTNAGADRAADLGPAPVASAAGRP